jgi:hypothetical protein
MGVTLTTCLRRSGFAPVLHYNNILMARAASNRAKIKSFSARKHLWAQGVSCSAAENRQDELDETQGALA